MADFKNRSSVAVAGGVTGNRDLISSPSLLRWAAEGKVFSAGLGAEVTAVDSAAALADVSPTFALVAPSSSNLFVVPIYMKMAITGDGGAAPSALVAITKAASNCGTTLVCSGTALEKLNHNSQINDEPQAAALHTVTASALVAADYIRLNHITMVDAVLTTGAPMASDETSFDLDLFKEAWLLSQGAALLVYCFTGTTDSTWVPYITWAEVTANDLY